MSAALELERVSFAYTRHHPILDEVSMTFEAAQAHAVVGPSGCGKSTLLYIAGLMLRPTTGALRLFGESREHLLDFERATIRLNQIGFLFQDALLDQSLTVWDNLLEVPCTSMSRRAYKAECLAGLERLGLADLRHRKAGLLSGGQAQRIAAVRALAKRPAILLADEPTGNLDPESAQVVMQELVSHSRAEGCVGVIITHSPDIAQQCDSVHHLSRLPVAGVP